MIKDINFLAVKNKSQARRQKGLLIIRVIAVLFLIVLGFSTGLAYYLSSSIYPKSLKKEQDSLTQTLNSLRTKQVKLTVINNRLNTVSEILSKRSSISDKTSGQEPEGSRKDNYSKIISKFSESIPEGVTMDNFKADKDSIILSFSSNSLLPIEILVDNLVALGREKVISFLTLDSLSLNQGSGTYLLSLKASL